MGNTWQGAATKKGGHMARDPNKPPSDPKKKAAIEAIYENLNLKAPWLRTPEEQKEADENWAEASRIMSRGRDFSN
ncbi:MAG: hypothetical protein ABII13_02230 [Patescibacteria group bacterium]|nr:hypothetical protein [Patescibacteria group bacterium]MBU2509071.1 hypothetical protein [Patescibacteria group bacterium]